MAAPEAVPGPQKPIHSLIIDTGPLINNAVSISTIINSAEELYTTPAILSEIRDEATRSRVQTTLVPFLKIRNPSPASYSAVILFSKKTGDHDVLSKQDLGILALAYEIHCERNGGNWGLREAPKQAIKRRPGETEEKQDVEQKQSEKKPRKSRQRKAVAGQPAADEIDEVPAVEEGWEQPRGKRAIKSKHIKPVKKNFAQETANEDVSEQNGKAQTNLDDNTDQQGGIVVNQEQILEGGASVEPVQNDTHGIGDQREDSTVIESAQESIQEGTKQSPAKQLPAERENESRPSEELLEIDQAPVNEIAEQTTSTQEISKSAIAPAGLEQDMADLTLSPQLQDSQQVIYEQLTPPATSTEPDSDSDSDGSWITPTNLSAHQAKDSGIHTHAHTTKPSQIDIATMTTDFAMQNVLLQMNLQLLSTNMQRIKYLSTKVLRCHACFAICKDTSKQFCPRCGQATLRRVSCSTDANGAFRIHLAKNYQWNTRGDKYSIPKPVAGTANGKWSGQGGGKGGWGRDLVLAEDQKEFQRGVEQEKRRRARDLMDEDYLPGILTGERGGAAGKVKVGAGRNVNSRKKF